MKDMNISFFVPSKSCAYHAVSFIALYLEVYAGFIFHCNPESPSPTRSHMLHVILFYETWSESLFVQSTYNTQLIIIIQPTLSFQLTSVQSGSKPSSASCQSNMIPVVPVNHFIK